MTDETTPQDFYPKAIDPWLANLMGGNLQSQFLDGSVGRTYSYDGDLINKETAPRIIRRVIAQARWETIATDTGYLIIRLYAGARMEVLEAEPRETRVLATINIGELIVEFNLGNV